MESKRVQRLKLTMRPLAFNLFLFLFTTALFPSMSPAIGLAQAVQILTMDGAFTSTCDLDCFNPDGESDPDQVRGATVFVGSVVQWSQFNLGPFSVTANPPFSVTASTTQGDYQGHTCPEPGGLNGIILTHEDVYRHTFTTVGDCYYRSTFQPPGTGYPSYPGMQAVIHVLPATGPSAYWLMPVNISTLPSVAQTFTAFYADPGNSLPTTDNFSDTSLTLSGVSRSETLHYNPATNLFTLQGAAGTCGPGDSATLTDGNLTLDCSASSVLGTGGILQVTYNLTPQPSLSGNPYQLTVAATEIGGATSAKSPGTWVVNRAPSANSVSPMNSTTPVGSFQTFTVVYSDPDGWQNIAAANLYFSGNGGMHNEWLHYLVAPNLFTMMGSNDSCSPGQMKMLTNGYLTLDCSSSSVSGSGLTLTIIYRLKVEAPAGGITFTIFSAASDQAGMANAIFAGTWGIQ